MEDGVIDAVVARIRRGRAIRAVALLAWSMTARDALAQTTQPAADPNANQRCLNCHGQAHIAQLSTADRRGMIAMAPGESQPERPNLQSLFVDSAARMRDVHRALDCAACHPGAERLPHPARLPPAQCASCHVRAADDVIRSIHATASTRAGVASPTCADCHGTHDIRPKSDPESKTNPLHAINTCGGCHVQHHGKTPDGLDAKRVIRGYLDSVHGRAVARAGLVVAATCADCHGHHDVRPARDPESTIHRTNVPRTCGRCHVGIEMVFAESVHGQIALNGGGSTSTQPAAAVPVCSDCHSAHEITRADTPEFLRDIVNECGTCHADLYRTYRASYHGQVNALGSLRAARCSDCHGAHNIKRVTDPTSTLAPDQLADTCARCHVELKRMSRTARENFVKYRPHSDYRDRRRDPVLFYIWLYFLVVMGVTFTFWGLHSIAWFVRGTLDHRAHPDPPHAAEGQPVYRRFSAWHRWTHALVIVSFFGLTLTGLPLKFSDARWAVPLMRVVGGPETAGTLHRCFAVLVLVYLAMHLIHLWRLRRGGQSFLRYVFGPASMLPTATDWRQFKQMVRWFFGRGPRPEFDRWTYWEKFDYWADLFGTGIIGGSGLLLWFPTFFCTVLSGYWFNIATVVHGYEALLAAGFIFSIHFFNAHLRREKFPVDKVIFTGRITEAEFREERPAQYRRLKESGELERLRVPPAPRWLERLATVIGVLALLVGALLIVLIIRAGLN
ncbi:MAG: hypothetical protein L6Q92_15330 [Phycisphaerae bacterium]|nr:hypothetical protein [Phycisphaerae bacterium]